MDVAERARLIVWPMLDELTREGAAQLASEDAARQLLAMSMQEDPQADRMQRGGGPARGLWQFETTGLKIALIRSHPAILAVAERLRLYRPSQDTLTELHERLAFCDFWACLMARALLWADKAPLPVTQQQGWGCYLRTWNPGKPRLIHWPKAWAMADQACVRDTWRLGPASVIEIASPEEVAALPPPQEEKA